MRPVFILGTGRCGSTLVHDLLAQHPAVAYVSAADERLRRIRPLGRAAAQMYRGSSAPARALTAAPGGAWLRQRFAPSEAYLMLSDDVSPIVATPPKDLVAEDVTPWLEQRFRAFFERHAAAHRADVLVHKFTGWPRARFIHRVFPEALFIHVVRDPRAVANSWVQMRWWPPYHGMLGWGTPALPTELAAEWDAGEQSFPLLAALHWRLLIDAFAAARAAVPSASWLEVRYEDFVTAPREHLRRMLGAIELPWSSEFERGLAQRPVSPGRLRSFCDELPERDLRLIERALAPYLERYGYDRGR